MMQLKTQYITMEETHTYVRNYQNGKRLTLPLVLDIILVNMNIKPCNTELPTCLFAALMWHLPLLRGQLFANNGIYSYQEMSNGKNNKYSIFILAKTDVLPL